MSGVLVPIAFFAMVAAICVLPNYFKYRERSRMQDILRIAYERGQPMPPEVLNALQSNIAPRAPSTPERDLRLGVILIACGLGLCALGYGLWYGLMSVDEEAAYISGGSTAGLGAIPGLIGLAYLVLWITRRNARDTGV